MVLIQILNFSGIIHGLHLKGGAWKFLTGFVSTEIYTTTFTHKYNHIHQYSFCMCTYSEVAKAKEVGCLMKPSLSEVNQKAGLEANQKLPASRRWLK